MGSMLNIPSRMEGPEQKTIIGKSEITVSTKGIANGKSVYHNDGADFGPDTPGTTTFGWQEGLNEAIANGNNLKILPGTVYSGSNNNYNALFLSLPHGKSCKISAYGVTLQVYGAPAVAYADTSAGNKGWNIEGLNIEYLSTSASTNYLVDLHQSETGGTGVILQDIYCNNTSGAQYAYGINMNGNEDSYLIRGFSWLQFSMVTTGGMSHINGLSTSTAILSAQTIDAFDVIANQIQWTPSANGSILTLIHPYQNSTSNSSLVLEDSTYKSVINIIGGDWSLNANNPFIQNNVTETTIINFMGLSLNNYYSSTTALNLSNSYSNLIIKGLHSVTSTTNTTNLPATGFALTTPALPAATGSADAVTNTFPFPVRVFQAGESGTHIVDSAGNDVLLPADPAEVTLDPGDKIYYATTVATSWRWYGV